MAANRGQSGCQFKPSGPGQLTRRTALLAGLGATTASVQAVQLSATFLQFILFVHSLAVGNAFKADLSNNFAVEFFCAR